MTIRCHELSLDALAPYSSQWWDDELESSYHTSFSKCLILFECRITCIEFHEIKITRVRVLG